MSSKPLHPGANSALAEASARAEWEMTRSMLIEIEREKAEASILGRPGRRRPPSADSRSFMERSSIDVPSLDGSSIFAMDWNPNKSISFDDVGAPRPTSTRFPGPKALANRRRPATAGPSGGTRGSGRAAGIALIVPNEPEPEPEPEQVISC